MGASPDPPYLFATYIVTSNPNLISVASGLVHIIVSFIFVKKDTRSIESLKEPL
jgi:hypothetical protein